MDERMNEKKGKTAKPKCNSSVFFSFSFFFFSVVKIGGFFLEFFWFEKV